MSLFQTRPTTNALQRIMQSFKQFERKLDKLQDDVSFHGQTLNDLHVLLTNLSNNNNNVETSNPELSGNDLKRNPKKPVAVAGTGIQYDNRIGDAIKSRRNQVIQPLPTQIKAKSMHIMQREPSKKRIVHNKSQDMKLVPEKHKPTRPSKAESPRKANMLRTQNTVEKKTNKMSRV